MVYKMFIADLVMGSASFILMLIFFLITYKVIKIIRLGDKVLVSMLIFLDLTLVSNK